MTINIKHLVPMALLVFPNLHLVGGAVRDLLLGLVPKDLDFCTSATPEEVQRIARQHGLKVLLTGLKHGTVIVMVNGVGYDITTMRTDHNQDGRHAIVAWTRDILEDLKRRDFTVNAMAICVATGILLDPHNGQADLKARLIRAVGEPWLRLKEDLLRILRAARFAARLGFRIDPSLVRACVMMAWQIAGTVSIERVVMEFNKAFAQAEKPSVFLKHMFNWGILEHYLPELKRSHQMTQNPKHHPEGSVFNHILDVVDRAPATCRSSNEKDYWATHRWHALLHDIAKPATAKLLKSPDWYSFHEHEKIGAAMIPLIGQRLKLPNWLIESTQVVTRYHMRPIRWYNDDVPAAKAARKLYGAVGKHAEDLRVLVIADSRHRRSAEVWAYVEQVFTKPKGPVTRLALPINGDHLKAFGYKEGAVIGRMLAAAEAHAIETGISDKETLLRVALAAA